MAGSALALFLRGFLVGENVRSLREPRLTRVLHGGGLETVEQRQGDDEREEDGGAEPQAEGEHVQAFRELLHDEGVLELIFSALE